MTDYGVSNLCGRSRMLVRLASQLGGDCAHPAGPLSGIPPVLRLPASAGQPDAEHTYFSARGGWRVPREVWRAHRDRGASKSPGMVTPARSCLTWRRRRGHVGAVKGYLRPCRNGGSSTDGVKLTSAARHSSRRPGVARFCCRFGPKMCPNPVRTVPAATCGPMSGRRVWTGGSLPFGKLCGARVAMWGGF